MKCIPGGFLVVFEGIGGSGKTTLSKLLHEHLVSQGWDVRASREPGATELGADLRGILLATGSSPATVSVVMSPTPRSSRLPTEA